jgi:hypothetical protein
LNIGQLLHNSIVAAMDYSCRGEDLLELIDRDAPGGVCGNREDCRSQENQETESKSAQLETVQPSTPSIPHLLSHRFTRIRNCTSRAMRHTTVFQESDKAVF